jgi:hypothetical protein
MRFPERFLLRQQVVGTRFRFVQGDQIGQIFAFWVIVYFGQITFFQNYSSSQSIWTAFYNLISLVFLTKIRLGHILDDLFTNSSRHRGVCLSIFLSV